MKDIVFINHFSQTPGEKGNGRFAYLEKMIAKDDASVEMITSSFSHRTKKQRDISDKAEDIDYRLTLIYEPGYSKNVCLRRFYSHYIMARNLKKYLKTRKKPDVIYCSVPSLDVAYTAAKYAKKNNIKLIIDIQDLWPEAFEMVFNIPIISKLIFYPMRKIADRIYGMADEIAAVSDTYVERALKVNKKVENGTTVFLGTEAALFDEYSQDKAIIEKNKGEFWIAYCGTLGNSYDLTSVIDALEILKHRLYDHIKVIVMGDGPLAEKFEVYAKKKDINAIFTGRLSYNEMVSLLCLCDVTINPIKKNAAQSIINKHGDYAASGLPVINTQECKEYCNLVEEYKMGFNCENGNCTEIADKLILLADDEALRLEMGQNARKAFEEKFNREITYNKLLDLIVR